MFIFLGNLWKIGSKLPAILALIRALVDVLGSETVQEILQSLKNVLSGEMEKESEAPTTEKGRTRLLERLRQRQALTWLGMTSRDYDELCRKNDVAGKSGEGNYFS